MIVYHGAITEVKYPGTEHSYKNLDFGKGFYVTTVKEQAKRWVRRSVYYTESNRLMSHIFAFN